MFSLTKTFPTVQSSLVAYMAEIYIQLGFVRLSYSLGEQFRNKRMYLFV